MKMYMCNKLQATDSSWVDTSEQVNALAQQNSCQGWCKEGQEAETLQAGNKQALQATDSSWLSLSMSMTQLLLLLTASPSKLSKLQRTAWQSLIVNLALLHLLIALNSLPIREHLLKHCR